MKNTITKIVTDNGIHTSNNITICMSLGHVIKTKKSFVNGRMEVGAMFVSEELKQDQFGHSCLLYTFA
jgi:hypothetical protein